MKKAFCFNIFPWHFLREKLSTSDLSFSQVTSVGKRELQEHFSASACGLSFKKISFSSLFPTSVTWEKLKSDVDKFCLRRGKNKYRNKILCLNKSRATVLYAKGKERPKVLFSDKCEKTLRMSRYTDFLPGHISVLVVFGGNTFSFATIEKVKFHLEKLESALFAGINR